MKKRAKQILKIVVGSVTFILFLAIMREIFQDGIMKMDNFVYEEILKHFIKDETTTIMKIITTFGSVIVICAIVILSCIIPKNKKISGAILINAILIAIANQTLKHVVQRERPIGARLIDEHGYSFPSGHSMVSMAVYGFFIYLIWKNVENKKIKIASIMGLSILIIMIGISRIYLGVHYTSDVVAGFLVAISYLIVYTNICSKYINKKGSEKNENEQKIESKV